ncbi:MAG: hypothetical protein IJ069_10685 [Prevotella sp.]|nr:hypothetical protein [Prevotella sp.]
MTDFLLYDLKVAVLIIVFYMFYRLMLSRETFHRVNRIVLLLTAVASFVLPLCVITIHETVTPSGFTCCRSGRCPNAGSGRRDDAPVANRATYPLYNRCGGCRSPYPLVSIQSHVAHQALRTAPTP